jgi:hypothetical protein
VKILRLTVVVEDGQQKIPPLLESVPFTVMFALPTIPLLLSSEKVIVDDEGAEVVPVTAPNGDTSATKSLYRTASSEGFTAPYCPKSERGTERFDIVYFSS